MAGGVWCWPGGIRSLCRLLEENGEAVEYDLIALGLRLDWLGSEALSWRDLWVIVRNSPRGSAVSRAVNGESDTWGMPEQLLAGLFDLLSMANWQRQGDEKADRPEPLPRPGVKRPDAWTGTPRTPDEIDQLMGWSR